MTLVMQRSLKTMEGNGVATNTGVTPLFSMKAMLQASSQYWLCVDTDTWCKRAHSWHLNSTCVAVQFFWHRWHNAQVKRAIIVVIISPQSIWCNAAVTTCITSNSRNRDKTFGLIKAQFFFFSEFLDSHSWVCRRIRALSWTRLRWKVFVTEMVRWTQETETRLVTQLSITWSGPSIHVRVYSHLKT